MSFFDFFKSNHAEEEKQAAKAALLKATETLNIDVSITAHENWKVRLEAYLEGRSNEDLRAEVVCCDDRCDLGHWIYGDGESHLGQYVTFQELKATHKMFHYTASSVVTMSQTGHKEEAQRLLAGEFSHLSQTIKRRLNDLKGLV